jgi:hypothetical protein
LPSLWQELSDEQRQDLQLHAAELGVFGVLVQLVQQHPEADSEEILVRWQGLPGFDDIQQLAQRQSLLDSAGQQKAFFEGIERMLKRRKGRPQVAEIRARVAASSSQVAPEQPDVDTDFDPFDELATDSDDYSDEEFPI